MNRRKFIGNLLKGSAGVVATAFVGDKIIDVLVPEEARWETIVAQDMGDGNVKWGVIRANEAPKFLRADGEWVVPTVNLKLNEVTVQPKVVKLKNYRYAL